MTAGGEGRSSNIGTFILYSFKNPQLWSGVKKTILFADSTNLLKFIRPVKQKREAARLPSSVFA
jgi:hypothetical protein